MIVCITERRNSRHTKHDVYYSVQYRPSLLCFRVHAITAISLVRITYLGNKKIIKETYYIPCFRFFSVLVFSIILFSSVHVDDLIMAQRSLSLIYTLNKSCLGGQCRAAH